MNNINEESGKMQSLDDKETKDAESIVLENIKDIEHRLKMMFEMKKLLIKQLKKDRALLRREKKLLEKLRSYK